MTPISYRKLTHVCIGTGTFLAIELLTQIFYTGDFLGQKALTAIAVVFFGSFATALLASKWLLGETVVAAVLFSFVLSAEDIGAAVTSLAVARTAIEIFAFVCMSWFIVVFGLVGSSLAFAVKVVVSGKKIKPVKRPA